ncbi:MAG TPA: family 43 glycosylhydrolase [Abditibacteriaceae bacterium]|jgi:hypothetical protein
MQYFKPHDEFFVGDCMPFFHEGTFHLIYLLDEKHHQGKNGLGGHQWAHASSTDLKNWVHHPLAIGIDEEWECSICTGSVFFHQGTFYAFYATRKSDGSEHLSLATSTDGIHFHKTTPNPFASPPAGYRSAYRDPFVFQDRETGLFHMLVTAARENQRLPQSSGCLAHLTSPDLRTWSLTEPFLTPSYRDVPECPNYFEWNGWYYLIFSNHGTARYRMSRNPLGPWLRPPVDTFDSDMSRVLKSAAFSGNRRLGVAFLPTRKDGRNDGELLYAGNAVFREIIQLEDGCLGTKFPPEMIPGSGPVLPLPLNALTSGVTTTENNLTIQTPEGFGAASLTRVPRDVRLCVEVRPQPHTGSYGLLLRSSGNYEKGCELRFYPDAQRVELGDQSICCVEGLTQPFRLDIVVTRDIVDVCIAERRCLIQRAPECNGDTIFFYCHNGEVSFTAIQVRELLPSG